MSRDPGELGEVTDLISRAAGGDREAMDRLMPVVYSELRAIAHNRLRAEPGGHTLDTTDLVHEAYLKLVDQRRASWRDRAHFFAVASHAMRRILIDYARMRGAAKRGGSRRRVPLDATHLSVEERADALIELDEVLRHLAEVDERLCRVVECRFFGGLTEVETGRVLGVSARTVRRDMVKAKALISLELADSYPGAPEPGGA